MTVQANQIKLKAINFGKVLHDNASHYNRLCMKKNRENGKAKEVKCFSVHVLVT